GPPDESGQTLTFKTVNDNITLFAVQPAIDSAGTLTFTPAPNAHGTATLTVTLKDNGGTANGGIDTSDSHTFTIVITKPHIWHNTNLWLPADISGLDINLDGHVAPADALAVI